MIAVAVTAILCTFGPAVVRNPSPRSLVPLLTAVYLAWAMFDALRKLADVSPRALAIIVPAVALVFASAIWHWQTVRHFQLIASFHSWQSHLYESSVQSGGGGVIVACGSGGCVFMEVPVARGASERAKMRTLAIYHASLRDKYQRAAARPWRNVSPDPPPPQ
jgi:hypothetical protein